MKHLLIIALLFILALPLTSYAQKSKKSGLRAQTLEGTVVDTTGGPQWIGVVVESSGKRYVVSISNSRYPADDPKVIGGNVESIGTRVRVVYTRVEPWLNNTLALHAIRIIRLDSQTVTSRGSHNQIKTNPLKPPTVVRGRGGSYVLKLTRTQMEAVSQFLQSRSNLILVTPEFDKERNSKLRQERNQLLRSGQMQFQYACWGDLNQDSYLDVALVFATRNTVNDWGWRVWWIVAFHGNASGRFTPTVIAKEEAGAFDGLVYEKKKNLITAALFGTHDIGSYRWDGRRYVKIPQ